MNSATTFDTIVIGAGLMGASAARRLAAQGRVLVLEQFTALHDRGSSHGGSRIFRHAYVDELHTRLAIRADGLWGELEQETDEKLLVRTGGVDLFAEDDPELPTMLRSLEAAGSPGELLTGEELAARWPVFRAQEGVRVVYHPASAVVPATRAVATLLRSAISRGAVLHENEQLLSFEASGGGISVITTKASYSAGSLVIAAGGWLAQVAGRAQLPLVVTQQQVQYVRVLSDPAAHMVGRLPVFIERKPGGQGGLYGLPGFEYPHAVKVAMHGGAHAVPSADQRTFELNEQLSQEAIQTARRLLPSLDAMPFGAVTCLYTNTPDEQFIVDRHPEHESVVLLGGGSGHAFKFGPLFGELTAGLLSGGPTIPEFGLQRFGNSR